MGKLCFFFFFQAEDGIRDKLVTGVQTCALPIAHLKQTRNLFCKDNTGVLSLGWTVLSASPGPVLSTGLSSARANGSTRIAFICESTWLLGSTVTTSNSTFLTMQGRCLLI